MIVGGIRWVAGEGKKTDCSGTVWSNFHRTVLVADANQPIGIDVAKDGKVYWSEMGQVGIVANQYNSQGFIMMNIGGPLVRAEAQVVDDGDHAFDPLDEAHRHLGVQAGVELAGERDHAAVDLDQYAGRVGQEDEAQYVVDDLGTDRRVVAQRRPSARPTGPAPRRRGGPRRTPASSSGAVPTSRGRPRTPASQA